MSKEFNRLLDRCSTWKKVVRVLARMFRWKRKDAEHHELDASDLQKARLHLVWFAQKDICGLSPSAVLFGRPLRDVLPFPPRSQVHDNPSVRPLWREIWSQKEDSLRIKFGKQVESLTPSSALRRRLMQSPKPNWFFCN